MCEMDVEIEALRIRFNQDISYRSPTSKQLEYLNTMMSNSLKDSNNRMEVISMIIGHRISTTYQLSRWVASILIDHLKSDGVELVRTVEDSVKAQSML